MSSVDWITDQIEEYGQERYDEGYDDGRQSAFYELSIGKNYDKPKVNNFGFIERTHVFNGEMIHVWIEGPDFKGERFQW